MPSDRQHNIASLWRPDPALDVSLFKARFTTFAYDRHTHDEFAIGVMCRGVQRFHHKGTLHDAPPLSMITVNPDEVHDGMPGSDEGYAYRMLYVGLPYLEASFGDLFSGEGLRAFACPVTFDAPLARRLALCLNLLDGSPGRTEELLLPVLHELFARHAFPNVPSLPLRGHEASVRRVVEHIRSHPTEELALEELAGVAGLSKYHFLRVFQKQIGLTPHAFVLRHRTGLAKKMLEQGHPPSQAAALAGFADQSHLTRRFKAVYGLTPGRFQSRLS